MLITLYGAITQKKQSSIFTVFFLTNQGTQPTENVLKWVNDCCLMPI